MWFWSFGPHEKVAGKGIKIRASGASYGWFLEKSAGTP